MSDDFNRHASRCLNAMFMSLYLIVMVIGVYVGIILVKPSVQIKVHTDGLNALGTWLMNVDSRGNLVTGASFDIKIEFYNQAIFPLPFKTREISFYHYPIGSHLECLKCNYKGEDLMEPSAVNRIQKLHNSVVGDDHGLVSLKDLFVTVPPKCKSFDIFSIKVPFRAYFSIESTDSNTLSELKSLYLDCKKHKKVLLSMRLKDVETKYLLIREKVPLLYDIMLPLNCEVQGSVDGLFRNVNPKMTGTILENKNNIANKDINTI